MVLFYPSCFFPIRPVSYSQFHGTCADERGETVGKLHYGWIIVIFGAIIVSSNALGIYGFGVFLAPLTAEFGWERGALSGAMGVGSLLQGALALVSGRLTDRFGPRILVTFAGLLLGTGFFLMSRVTELWQVYIVWGIAVGGEMGFTLIPINATIPRWFHKNRGLAIAIPAAGFGLGAVVAPVLIQQLVLSFDWRTCFVILAIITFVITIPLAQFLRQDPAQKGIKPFGADPNAPASHREVTGMPFGQAAKTSQFWVFACIQFGFLMCMQTMITHLVPLAKDIGILPMAAAASLSILAGSSVVGRLSIGYISDRIGSLRTLMMAVIMLTIALVWLMMAQNLWMIYAFAIIFGLAYGGVIPLFTVVPAELFGLKYLGMITGALMFLSGFGAALGPPLAGGIYDAAKSYTPALPIFVGVGIAVVVLAFFLMRSQRGVKKEKPAEIIAGH